MIKFFIDQSKLINLAAIFILVAGVYYFVTGQKEGFPNIGFDLVIVNTAYPGLSATEIEASVTRKLEEKINNVEGKKSMTSYSSEGSSSIVFQVDPNKGIPISKVLDDIETAVNTAKAELPDDANDPSVRELTFQNSSPILRVGVSGDIPQEELKELIDLIYDEIIEINGIGNVEKAQYLEKEVLIEVKPSLLKRYDLEISDISKAIRDNNIALPAGKVIIEGSEYLIKTEKKAKNLDDIRNTIVRGNDVGNVVRIRDVASVKYDFKELEVQTRINGQSGAWLNVFQSLGGDVISIADGVKKTVAKLREDKVIPDEVVTIFSDDLSFYVKRRLNVLAQNATIGLLLVFLCLILFFDFRVTFWTTAGIPLAFCMAIIAVYNFGMTLNLMTMFGFIIVLGMIVDDAIIIAENIYSKREQGMPAYQAAIEGSKEMFKPILAITATTAIAFFPLTTLPNIFGKILGIIPIVVIITMFASFIECIFVLPGHMAFEWKKKSPKKKEEFPIPQIPAKEKKRHWFFTMQDYYGGIITRFLNHPYKIFTATTIGVFLLGGLSIYNTPFVFFPGSVEQVNINLTTPVSNSVKATAKIVDEAERILRESEANQYIREYISTAGEKINSDNRAWKRSYLGNLKVVFDPGMDITPEELIAIIDEEMKKLKGIEEYEVRQIKGGPPPGSPIRVLLYANNLTTLKNFSDELKKYLEETPNTTALATSFSEGKAELVVKVNQTLASINGVSISGTANALRNAFSTTKTTVANSMGGSVEDIDIVVRYPQSQVENVPQNLNTISSTLVKNNRGFNLPLRNFSSIETQESVDIINKENKKTYVAISGELKNSQDKENSGASINKKLEDKIKELLPKYAGVTYEFSGARKEQSELSQAAIRAVIMAIAGVFLVLVAIFRSYLQPFMVMSILPFTIMGVFIGLFLNRTPIGLMPFLGIVALTGIVVNDSLVMVDRINNLLATGMEKKQAIIEGAKSRLRPILMTSATTIVGIGPLAYGIFGSEPFIAPMAITLLVGLMFSTIFLIFVFPLIFFIIDDISARLLRKIG